jgi:hypothetical protein
MSKIFYTLADHEATKNPFYIEYTSNQLIIYRQRDSHNINNCQFSAKIIAQYKIFGHLK